MLPNGSRDIDSTVLQGSCVILPLVEEHLGTLPLQPALLNLLAEALAEALGLTR
jgi:hypothetical protein